MRNSQTVREKVKELDELYEITAQEIFLNFYKDDELPKNKIVHYAVLAHLCNLLFGEIAGCTRLNFDTLIACGMLIPADKDYRYPFNFFVVDGVNQVTNILKQFASIDTCLSKIPHTLQKESITQLRAFLRANHRKQKAIEDMALKLAENGFDKPSCTYEALIQRFNQKNKKKLVQTQMLKQIFTHNGKKVKSIRVRNKLDSESARRVKHDFFIALSQPIFKLDAKTQNLINRCFNKKNKTT